MIVSYSISLPNLNNLPPKFHLQNPGPGVMAQ